LKAAKQADGLTVQYWTPGINDEAVEKFYGEGKPVIFSNMFKLYFDYPHAITPLKNVYNYKPAVGINAHKPAINAADHAYGLEACLWTERIETDEKLEQMLFPRLFALAEAAWSGPQNYEDFKRRLEAVLARLDKQGIGYTPLSEVDPDDKVKLNVLTQAFALLKEVSQPDENRIDPAEMFNTGNGDFIGTFINGFDISPEIVGKLMSGGK
jgi:hypothetical protein